VGQDENRDAPIDIGVFESGRGDRSTGSTAREARRLVVRWEPPINNCLAILDTLIRAG
jgi:hypothetical protein